MPETTANVNNNIFDTDGKNSEAINGITTNPNVLYGTLNPSHINLFPKTTREGVSEETWYKYDIGSIDIASQIVRGTMTFNKEKLRQLDPSYSGYTHIFVLSMPDFMAALARGDIIGTSEEVKRTRKAALYHYRNLKALIEMGSTSYQGTPDLTLQTDDVNVGWSEKNFAVPTTSSYDGTQFTITCIETYGEPLRRAVEFYIHGVADPNAKYQHLHNAGVRVGNSSSLTPMQPSLANITFSIMVVQTDQTLHNIQNIDIWNNCMFTTVSRSHMDWTLGEVSTVQPQALQCRGIYLPYTESDKVKEFAKTALEKRLHYYKRLDDMSYSDLGYKYWTDVNEHLNG